MKQNQAEILLPLLVVASVVLAVLAHSLDAPLVTGIPVADFYDRVTGSSGNGLYFLSMYGLVAVVVPLLASPYRRFVPLAKGPRLLQALAGAVFASFIAYLCILMPATTVIGGGRFSMLLAASASSPILLGLVYGGLFCVLSVMLGLLAATLLGRH
jgi:hypothetical protein